MGNQKKKWSDFSTNQKRAVCAAGAAEAVLTVVALRDLSKRPSTGVRGPKVAWLLTFFVQPFGPLVYFRLGRR